MAVVVEVRMSVFHPRLASLFVAGVLAACQAPATGPKPTGAKASPKPVATAAVASTTTPRPEGSNAAPTATLAPLVLPTGAPASTDPLAGISKLLAPAGASTLLTGTLSVDAAYIVAAGGGNIVAGGGGNIVAAGGGNIVAGGGGNIVAAGGGNIVAAGGGNIVAAGGGNIVAAGGGNIVAAGGGNISLRSGSAIVAAGGGNYHVLAEGLGGPTAVQAGEQLPAVGMRLSVVSLATRKYLPLGVDAAGEPVYAIYSNAEGKFEVHVPPGDERNLLVVASVPGATDGRMVYSAFTPRAATAPLAVDEDTSIGARYLRRCFVDRLAEIVTVPDPSGLVAAITGDKSIGGPVKALLEGMCTHFRELAATRGIGPGADPAKVQVWCQAVVDATVGGMDLEAVKITKEVAKNWKRDDTPSAVATLGHVLQVARQRSEIAMRDPADPTRYKQVIDRKFLEAINAEGGTDAPPLRDPDRQIRKPADVADFVTDEFLSITRHSIYRPIGILLVRLLKPDAVSSDGDLEAIQLVNDVQSGTVAMITAVAFALVPGEGNAVSAAADQAGREVEIP